MLIRVLLIMLIGLLMPTVPAFAQQGATPSQTVNYAGTSKMCFVRGHGYMDKFR
jgi:hypothetical protein